MTTSKLAKLDDLKAALNASTSGLDTQLTQLLVDASAMAEQAAGVVQGGLRRQVDRVEMVWHANPYRFYIGLSGRPIESISQVVQLYRPGSDADFDAAAEAGGLILPDTQYTIASATLGTLQRIDGVSWRAKARHLRVVYTAGYADPDDEAAPDSALQPPDDLQRAVIAQATQLYNLRGKDGLATVQAGKSPTSLQTAALHPLLSAAAQRYRRMII